jgi:hypothetical protein
MKHVWNSNFLPLKSVNQQLTSLLMVHSFAAEDSWFVDLILVAVVGLVVVVNSFMAKLGGLSFPTTTMLHHPTSARYVVNKGTRLPGVTPGFIRISGMTV